MSDLLTVILLGLVQGLTEWLPVSSSGHLVLVGQLRGDVSLVLDLALHLGTTMVLVAYFRKDLVRLTRAMPGALRQGLRERSLERVRDSPDRLVVWWVILVTIPTGLIAVPLAFILESRFTTNLVTVGLGLILTSLLLLLGRHHDGRGRSLTQLHVHEVLVLGIIQGIAVLPGVSRSGSTISVGMRQGLSPAEAGRLSFLMAIPAILGAGLLSLVRISETVSAGDLQLALVGIMLAAVIGYLTLHWLMGVLQRGSDLSPFAWYTLPLGLLVLLWGLGLLG